MAELHMTIDVYHHFGGSDTPITDQLNRMETIMTDGFSRLDASYEGISGDIAALKASAVSLSEQVATLTAGQDAAVAAGVEAALTDFNGRLDTVAARFEGLDAENPPAEPPPAV